MSETAPAAALPAGVETEAARLAPRDVAIALLTYNNAATAPAVAEVARAALEKHAPGMTAALIIADAGSADGTREALGGAGLPIVAGQHEAPLTERAAVPYHGVPGRGAALRLAFSIAQRLGVRALLLLEADVTSITDEWVERLLKPVRDQQAELVVPTYARHRYDGTITNLLLVPLVQALIGRRVRYPLSGAQALSGRLVEHLLAQPGWTRTGREMTDLWALGVAARDGFVVWEAWLGRRRVESRTRTADLPTMVAQTLGGIFTLMERFPDLWLEPRGIEPLRAVGDPVPPSAEPMAVDVERMVAAFRLGLRDLGSIWEHILTPETLADVLTLDVPDVARFRFSDDLWARVVYEFALGFHYGVVHREHLLRSLVPLYLGRTAAFVGATRDRTGAHSEAAVDAIGGAFVRHKPYLVERWR